MIQFAAPPYVTYTLTLARPASPLSSHPFLQHLGPLGDPLPLAFAAARQPGRRPCLASLPPTTSTDPRLINSLNASLWLPPPQQTRTSPVHRTPTTWVSQPMRPAILICLAIPMTSRSPAFLHCQHSPKPRPECQAVSPPPSSVTTTLVGSVRDNELLAG